jgi:hypothetical protein
MILYDYYYCGKLSKPCLGFDHGVHLLWTSPAIKALVCNLSAFTTLFAPGKSWDNVRTYAAPYTQSRLAQLVLNKCVGFPVLEQLRSISQVIHADLLLLLLLLSGTCFSMRLATFSLSRSQAAAAPFAWSCAIHFRSVRSSSRISAQLAFFQSGIGRVVAFCCPFCMLTKSMLTKSIQ